MKRIFSQITLAFFAVLALLLAQSINAGADQPRTLGWEIIKGALNGTYIGGTQPGGDDQVLVELFAASRELLEMKVPLLVVFPGCTEDPKIAGRPVLNLNEIINRKATSPQYAEYRDPGPRWRMCPERNALLLMPGQGVQLILNVDFLRAVNEGMRLELPGKVYQLTEQDLKLADGDADKLSQMMTGRHPIGSIVIDLFYRLTVKLTWIRGDYAKIFGAPLRGILEARSTGDYTANDDILPVVVLNYRRDMRLPGSFKDDGGARMKKLLEIMINQGSGQAGQEFCFEEEFYVPLDLQSEGIVTAASYSHVITGMFSTKWSSDHSLHPGFGFSVEAWTNETGSWARLAAGWVQSNGTWQLNIDSALGYQGKHLRVLYRSYNGYYAPQNQDGNKYSWKDPDRYNIPSSYYVGHRYADTDGGLYNGVGELVEAAMYMWSRLYWDAGVNPVPSSPIKFYFPNTWYDCGDGSGVPWSCANTSGEIWLIASHGVQADVVTHEMGHQLNNKYWGNKRPAGSGGSHTLTGCYSTRLGMALREGFANFIPAWVGYPGRNVADGGFSSGRWALEYDAESHLSPPNCANGWENEVWVARTFWDLHDTRSDNDDILWFIHRGAVIALYLSNGIANDGDARDMRYYETIYRNAATPGHEGFITDIFEQNRN
jgi:hypothetical protein